jgi:hypothetical protein
MKKYILIIIFQLYLLNNYAQTEWFYRNTINQELTFKTDFSCFKNLSLIINSGGLYQGKYVALIGKDSVSLVSAIGDYFRLPGIHYSKNQFKSYVAVNSPSRDNLYIILTFCYEKLYCVSLYAKGSYYVSNIKRDFARQFDWKKVYVSNTETNDSIVHYGNRIVTYGNKLKEIRQSGENKKFEYIYEENLVLGNCVLTIMDKDIQKRIPSWCGNSRDSNTWEKLEKYLKTLEIK